MAPNIGTSYLPLAPRLSRKCVPPGIWTTSHCLRPAPEPPDIATVAHHLSPAYGKILHQLLLTVHLPHHLPRPPDIKLITLASFLPRLYPLTFRPPRTTSPASPSLPISNAHRLKYPSRPISLAISNRQQMNSSPIDVRWRFW